MNKILNGNVSKSLGFCRNYSRGGSRGRVQGVPPPRNDLRFSNTTGILQKLCGLLVLK